MKSNSSLHSFMLSGEVSGVHIPFWKAPGFVIPLIRRGISSNTLYIQKTNTRGKITGFEYVDFLKIDYVTANNYVVDLGGEEVFAVMDPQGSISVGTREELTPVVVGWVIKIEDHLTRYSFARFCGEEAIEISSATSMYKKIKIDIKSDDVAIAWFVRALVLSELRDAVRLKTIAGNHSEENQNELFLFIDTGVRLILELREDLGGSDLAHKLNNSRNLRKIFRLVHSVTGKELVFAEYEGHRRISTLFVDEQTRLSEARSKIAKAKKQEDRFALTVLQVLTDVDVGLLILSSHQDRASFIKYALEEIRHVVGNGKDTRHMEARISSQIKKIVSNAYPLQRVRLILSMADYLSEFQTISMTLRDIVQKSSAKSIVAIRDRVFDALRR